MSIQEALKSGKPFRRLGWKAQVWVVSLGNQMHFHTGEMQEKYGRFNIKPDDISTNDWEIKP